MCRSKTSKPQNETIGVKPPSKQGEWVSSYDPFDPNQKVPSKAEIKASIPPECFVRSAAHSFLWVLIDTVQAAICAYAAYNFLPQDLPSPTSDPLTFIAYLVGWNVYAFCMGTVLTGHWVIAHECGHGAFSTSKALNDTVGFVLHQALLVPYFGWQYTHAKHHRRTNNLVDGESHVPTTASENGVGDNGERLGAYAWLHEMMDDGIFAGFQVFTHLVIGWPIYLLGFASTGRLGADGKPLNGAIADHYRPWSPMFPTKLQSKIYLSTTTVILTLLGLAKLSQTHGFLKVCVYYVGPYMWTNAWLVLYTWLQHNDPSVPQYGSDEWTWVKGALSTIDRPYGIFDHFHHKIGSTHVAHHLFHEMPFYKADVATEAVKGYLGPLYNYDPTPWYKALWKVANTCHYVEGTEGVQYPKSMNDLPRTGKMKRKIE
ncbi:hypothetical protein TrCOL_g9116 [Triparma columacea]|uniref:Fatty acid desaturase domain-containing protein n=1 Tax=Triparma columacea TaxID=722753 RepID=A0A9W7L9J5_9STRA|nr:hypothetical protein TrCOL_g9116 [Triparma columacea]